MADASRRHGDEGKSAAREGSKGKGAGGGTTARLGANANGLRRRGERGRHEADAQVENRSMRAGSLRESTRVARGRFVPNVSAKRKVAAAGENSRGGVDKKEGVEHGPANVPSISKSKMHPKKQHGAKRPPEKARVTFAPTLAPKSKRGSNPNHADAKKTEKEDTKAESSGNVRTRSRSLVQHMDVEPEPQVKAEGVPLGVEEMEEDTKELLPHVKLDPTRHCPTLLEPPQGPEEGTADEERWGFANAVQKEAERRRLEGFPPGEGEQFLLQLPFVLPLSRQPNQEMGELERDVQGLSLADLPSGKMGRMIVYDNGEAELVVGDITFDLIPSSPCNFRQDVAMISTGQEGGEMVMMGDVKHTILAVPNIPDLLESHV